MNADLLEEIAAELDEVSRSVFSTSGGKGIEALSNDELRQFLTKVGTAGARLGRLRDSLLRLNRILSLVTRIKREWIPNSATERLQTSESDVISLNE